jgi:hypothetical protein
MDFPDNSNSRELVRDPPRGTQSEPWGSISSSAAGLLAGIPNCAVPDGATALAGIVGMGAIGRAIARRGSK